MTELVTSGSVGGMASNGCLYPEIATLRDNSRLLVRVGMTGAMGNIYCGLHEFEDMACPSLSAPRRSVRGHRS